MWFWKRWQLNTLLKKAQKEIDKREQGKQGNMQNEVSLHLKLAKFHQQFRFDRTLPFAEEKALEFFRHAANLGSTEGQYHFGEKKLEQGKFWDEFSKGIYGRPIHKDYAKGCFDEAFQYLKEAQNAGYPLAIRTLGLAHIHGWGTSINKEYGFKLVVESIDTENSWDKAPELFKTLGLNNPEFFSTMMAMRRKNV